MTAPARAASRNPWLTAAAWKRLLRDKPLIPLEARGRFGE